MLKSLQTVVKMMNNSKLFAGVLMLIMNIGSRYIQVKFTKRQEAFLRNYVVREVLIFAILWMATRDLFLSIVLTLSFFIVTEYLFNESSHYCMLPQSYRELQKHLDQDGDGKVSDAEIAEAVEVLKRAKDNKLNNDKEQLYSYFTKASKQK
jgi:hypothetical protein